MTSFAHQRRRSRALQISQVCREPSTCAKTPVSITLARLCWTVTLSWIRLNYFLLILLVHDLLPEAEVKVAISMTRSPPGVNNISPPQFVTENLLTGPNLLQDFQHTRKHVVPEDLEPALTISPYEALVPLNIGLGASEEYWKQQLLQRV